MGDLVLLPFTKNYIQNRIDRFHKEFLQSPYEFDNIEQMLVVISDYMTQELPNHQDEMLAMSLCRVNEAFFWLHSFNADQGQPLE